MVFEKKPIEGSLKSQGVSHNQYGSGKKQNRV